jgi:integrase
MSRLALRAITTDGPITDEDVEFLTAVSRIPRGTPKIKFLIELPVFRPALKVLKEQNYVTEGTRNYALNAIVDGLITYRVQPHLWTKEQWAVVQSKYGTECRTALMSIAARGYGVFPAFTPATTTNSIRAALAERIFGMEVVDREVERVCSSLTRLGFTSTSKDRGRKIRRCVADLMLFHRSDTLDVITDKSLAAAAAALPSPVNVKVIGTVSHALVDLGIIPVAFSRRTPRRGPLHANRVGVSDEWLCWCRRWQSASSLSERTKRGICNNLVTAGRWLNVYHPEFSSPAQWTLDLGLEFVRFVTKMRVGELVGGRCRHVSAGSRLMPHTQNGILSAMRRVFRDLQQWEWIETRFRPERGFATPLQIRRSFELSPRPIDEGFWLKLRAAALSLNNDDLPSTWKTIGRYWFPRELIRAVAVSWLFSGCRSDEIERLEVGCAHVEHVEAQGTIREAGPKQSFDQPMLRVPVSKTRGEFVKPVELPLLEAIQSWEAVRPRQAPVVDPTTKRPVHPLFAYRGRRIGENFINRTIIPILLRKAGLPKCDSRGPITSHRARATMATKLYSNESGMGSMEVMKWLGHRSFASTQHYLELTPTKLMRAFHRQGALSEKIRYVSVLVDPKPEANHPSIYYDLGHGWCTNHAYSACAHRMACARCDFYVPDNAAEALFKRQGQEYVKMLQQLDLTEDEQAAISGDSEAVATLLVRLAKAPVPSREP